MKTSRLILLVGLLSVPLGLFAFRNQSWECSYKLNTGTVQRTANSLKISNRSTQTAGVIISNVSMSIDAPMADRPMILEDIGSNGDYTFHYSTNVKKVIFWSRKTKVYEGPPIASFKIGRGPFAIEPVADEPATVEAISRCSIAELF